MERSRRRNGGRVAFSCPHLPPDIPEAVVVVTAVVPQRDGMRRRKRVMTGSPPIRILTVDDHPVVREGIAGLVGTQPDMTVAAEAANGREAIQQFRAHRPDVTLMDIQMPEMNGLDALIAIRAEFPDAKVVVLTTYEDGGFTSHGHRRIVPSRDELRRPDSTFAGPPQHPSHRSIRADARRAPSEREPAAQARDARVTRKGIRMNPNRSPRERSMSA